MKWYERLRLNAKDIQDKADSGDELCKQIISMYTMWWYHRDNCTIGMLIRLLNDYKDALEEESTS